MKTYKTWEIIKALTDNPTLRFKDAKGSVVTVNPDSKEVVWEQSGAATYDHKFVLINNSKYRDNMHTDWQLVQKPVTWQAAIEAYFNNIADVEVHLKDEVKTIKRGFGLGFYCSHYNVERITPKYFKYGTWYIIEGDK